MGIDLGSERSSQRPSWQIVSSSLHRPQDSEFK